MQESGLTEIVPFICISAMGPISCIFDILSSPWCSLYIVAAVWRLLGFRHSSPSWMPFRLTSPHWRAAIADDSDILFCWCGRKYSISQFHMVLNPLCASHQICLKPTIHWENAKEKNIFPPKLHCPKFDLHWNYLLTLLALDTVLSAVREEEISLCPRFLWLVQELNWHESLGQQGDPTSPS